MDVRNIEIRLHNPGQWQCTAKTLGGQAQYLQKDGDWRPSAFYFDSEEQIRTLLAKLQPSSTISHASRPEPEPEPEPEREERRSPDDDDGGSINLGGLLGGLLGGGGDGGFSGGGGDFGGGGAGGDW